MNVSFRQGLWSFASWCPCEFKELPFTGTSPSASHPSPFSPESGSPYQSSIYQRTALSRVRPLLSPTPFSLDWSSKRGLWF